MYSIVYKISTYVFLERFCVLLIIKKYVHLKLATAFQWGKKALLAKELFHCYGPV